MTNIKEVRGLNVIPAIILAWKALS